MVAKIDEAGQWAWIGLVVLAFYLFWPLGLALLIFLIGSGRMGCWKHAGWDRWHERMNEHGIRMRMHGRWHRPQSSSGNAAFDEYREDTLKRLEEEQKEFKGFLDRLRHAKDKAEFDQFMAERRRARFGAEPEGSV